MPEPEPPAAPFPPDPAAAGDHDDGVAHRLLPRRLAHRLDLTLRSRHKRGAHRYERSRPPRPSWPGRTSLSPACDRAESLGPPGRQSLCSRQARTTPPFLRDLGYDLGARISRKEL
ncbi:MAG: hypothetical protein MZV64_50505 [Ignavibacteriales bacterium]|nr:hypothetical protein [Ignavibacteriales bacterium]